MMKKALALAGAGAMLLSMAGPAFGIFWWMGSDDVNINNQATVTNNVTTQASTGYNHVGGGMLVCGKIRTGPAGATAIVYNDVNMNAVDCDGCDGDVDILNRATVTNNVTTQASSGYNLVGGGMLVGGRIRTGAAGATSMVTNFVNTNVVGGI